VTFPWSNRLRGLALVLFFLGLVIDFLNIMLPSTGALLTNTGSLLSLSCLPVGGASYVVQRRERALARAAHRALGLPVRRPLWSVEAILWLWLVLASVFAVTAVMGYLWWELVYHQAAFEALTEQQRNRQLTQLGEAVVGASAVLGVAHALWQWRRSRIENERYATALRAISDLGPTETDTPRA